MKYKTLEKVSFSRFFPTMQQYVVVQGNAKSPDDFTLSIDIGDGNNKSSFQFDPYYFSGKDAEAMLKSMRDAMQQALEFYEKALALPEIKPVKFSQSEWDSLFPKKEETKPTKKPAAKKKKAADKK